MRPYLNWKTYSLAFAAFIVGLAVFYFNKLAKDIAADESVKAGILAESFQSIATMPVTSANPTFESRVIDRLHTIPLILTDENGKIISYDNMDTSLIKGNNAYLNRKLHEFAHLHKPIQITALGTTQYIYYGESVTLQRLKIYPVILICVIAVFILIAVISISNAQRSLQNQVWVGMSKETAHQIGTPLSSIVAWMELLKDNKGNKEYVEEMEKDVARLQLIADRFSKIGSLPELKEENLVPRFIYMTEYMQKRAPKNVEIHLDYNQQEIEVLLNGPLFDWVIENLIRNALDAMEGKGEINIHINNQPRMVTIDIADTGKGIPKNNFKKVFTPGYSTKQRGWGLGLSLAKRIIEKYHNGSIFVKSSEHNKGTTFRIILRR